MKALIKNWNGNIKDTFSEAGERYIEIVDDKLNKQIRYEIKIVDGKLQVREVKDGD